MSLIRLAATAVTPEIEFHPGERTLRITGECYPENPLPFFEPVLASLQRYFNSEKPPEFEATFRLNYVNSASTKAFRNLFLLLESVGKAGASMAVNWEFDPDDDALQELGADLADDLHYVDLRLQAMT